MARGLVVVTGSSRGIGRAVVKAFVEAKWSEKIESLRAVLMARSETGLQETKELLERHSNFVNVECHVLDLSSLENVQTQVETIFNGLLPAAQYERTILINNAASATPFGIASTVHQDLMELRKAIDFNVTCSIFLSSKFAHMFAGHDDCFSRDYRCTIVNVSSLCAVQPFETCGVYCAGKAARNMFHSVMAKETSKGKPFFKTLNYAPGACETDMVDHVIQSEAVDEEFRHSMAQAKKEGTLIQAADTAKKLVKLVIESTFESGAHIDYWDISSGEPPRMYTSNK